MFLTDAEVDKHLKAIIHLLKSIPASKLTSDISSGGDLLDVSQTVVITMSLLTSPQIIDPSINTLPYLYILLAHITSTGGKQKANNTSDDFEPDTTLWQRMLNFTESFDRIQIRYAGDELRQLVEAIAAKARRISEVSLPAI